MLRAKLPMIDGSSFAITTYCVESVVGSYWSEHDYSTVQYQCLLELGSSAGPCLGSSKSLSKF